ncbi:MAG: NrfJ-related protein [Gallionellaceae bacterium]
MRSIFILLAASFFSVSAIAATSAQPATSARPMLLAANDQYPHTGKVLSSVDASIYTYIEVSENGKTVWLAAPTVAVKKGDTIGFDEGSPMANFYSKSLNRTFDMVYFVGKAVVIK